MSEVYFTSDPHFGHQKVIEYCNRPYTTKEEMDKDLIEKWNNTVRPEDTLYVLGDFSLSKHAVRDITPQLNGQKHLIMGNHDWCHPIRAKEKPIVMERFKNMYLEAGFASVKLIDNIEIDKTNIILHHMPYRNDGHDERYLNWRLEDKGSWLLHGHVHKTWKTRNKMINVGVDVWDYKPVHIDEIAKIIKEKI